MKRWISMVMVLALVGSAAPVMRAQSQTAAEAAKAKAKDEGKDKAKDAAKDAGAASRWPALARTMTVARVRIAQGKQYIPDPRKAQAVGLRGAPLMAAVDCDAGCSACLAVCPTDAVRMIEIPSTLASWHWPKPDAAAHDLDQRPRGESGNMALA